MLRTSIAVMAVFVASGMSLHDAVAQTLGRCTVTTTSVSFGSYDSFTAAPTDGEGTVSYTCLGLMKTLRISISTGGSGTYGSRRMSGPGSTLAYNLFLDATHQTIWGDGSGGSQPFLHNNIVIYVNYTATIYGRIPPLQSVALGTYSDSPVVTVEW